MVAVFFPSMDKPIVVLQSVYQWMVKPQTVVKTNEMFLPGRMSFIYNMVYTLTPLHVNHL